MLLSDLSDLLKRNGSVDKASMKTPWIHSLIRIAVAVLVLFYVPQHAQSQWESTLSAPTTAAQNAYAGCLVAPDDSIYNIPVDMLPVHANSADWIAQSLTIGSVGISFGESWDVNLVDNSVTPSTMTFHYTTARNGILYPLLTGNNRTREGGSYTTDGNNDHHMITLNRQTCHWYETYQDNLTSSVTPTPAPYAASGWDYLGTSYAQPTDGTTDAAGLPLMPLTVHLSEMQAGAIHHAMRFTSCAGCISNVALWPATGSTGYSAPSAPMGSRWRLKASYDDSRLSAKARIITTALKTYGMILADIGGISQIQIAQDVNLDPPASAAFGEVGAANITQDQFEIVDESGLMISANSHQAKGGTPTSAPALVGTASPVIFPQSGTSYQLPSWVNSASDQTVVWSLLSGAGAVTSAGLYTAPTGVTTPVPFLLKGVNEIDSLNPVFVSGYVMPAGTMRINVGDEWAYTDTTGNNWLADNFGVLAGSFMNNNDTYPANTWAAVGTPPDGQNVFGRSKYTWGDDIQYGPFIVPNGTYSVQFWMAVSCPAGTTYSETEIFGNGLTRGGTVGLEANGAMTLFSIGGAIKDACRTPARPTIQAVVTNNVLRVALRSTSVGNTQQSPFLNALLITPEAASQIVLNPANWNFGTAGSGGGYAYSRAITINHTLVPNTDQSNFPLLFSGTYPYLATAANGGGVQNRSGYDIVFASDAAGVNKLNFEQRSYNASTGQIQYWVQVPTVSHSTDTVIYLLYGNASVSTDPSNKAGTWSSNYKGVWHMDETAGTVLSDSTANANNSVKGSAMDPAPVTGYLGGGQQFLNAGNFATSAPSPSTNITSGGITISAIMYPTASNLYGGIYRRSSGPGDGGAAAQEGLMVNNVAGDITYTVEGTNVTWPMGPNYTPAYNQNAWNFITLTHDFSTNTVLCYLNGKLLPVKTATTFPISDANDVVILGNRAYGVGDNSFPGTLDEIRVSSRVLSQDWISTEYNNQSNPGAFYSVSP